jgi:hypothetical protein
MAKPEPIEISSHEALGQNLLTSRARHIASPQMAQDSDLSCSRLYSEEAGLKDNLEGKQKTRQN